MTCLICKIEKPARRPWLEGKQKYCSVPCQKLGQSQLKKGKQPYQMTAQIADKISLANSNGKPVYTSLHAWVKRHKGKAMICEKCNSTKDVQWANISQRYKRDLNDFFALCRECHTIYDMQHREERRSIAWDL